MTKSQPPFGSASTILHGRHSLKQIKPYCSKFLLIWKCVEVLFQLSAVIDIFIKETDSFINFFFDTRVLSPSVDNESIYNYDC